MVRLLACLKHHVESAASGPEAVKKVMKEHYDLVITDLEMPDMSGLELAKIVKGWQPRCPVVLLTGNRTGFNQKSDESSSIDAVIHKPVTLGMLKGSIFGILSE